MENFVNFITDKIKPHVIRAYLDGAGTDADFFGSDSSTMDFTKFGYVASVYRKMLRKGTVNQDVKDIVKYIGNIAIDRKLNYKEKSPSGYRIADMMVFDAQNDPFFKISELTSVVGEDFKEYVFGIINTSPSDGLATPLHMMIEFGLNQAIAEVPAKAFQYNPDLNKNQGILGAFGYALKRLADSNNDEDRLNTYNVIWETVNNLTYEELFGPHNRTLSGNIIYNDISKMIMLSSNETIKIALKQIRGISSQDALGIEPNIKAVTKAEGLSKNSIVFDIDIYSGLLENEQQKGYTPLFYYVNKFKGASTPEILDTLTKYYSPFAISVEDGNTEGYTPLSVLAASITISDDGNWNEAELVQWIKKQATRVNTSNPYKVYAVLGSVRDFTGGSSINTYGVVNNILRTINEYHRRTIEDGADSFDPTPLLNAVLPSCIDKTFYEEWMVEFGQEV